MDNQQGKNLVDIGWLAGFIDGEGSFYFNKAKKWRQEGHVWVPRIKVANTDYPTLEQVKRILTDHGFAFYVEERQQKTFNVQGKRNKPYWQVQIYGPKRCLKFCIWIAPYLFTKRREAEVVAEYCRLRLARPYEKNANGQTVRPPYSEQELELIASLRPLDTPHRLHA